MRHPNLSQHVRFASAGSGLLVPKASCRSRNLYSHDGKGLRVTAKASSSPNDTSPAKQRGTLQASCIYVLAIGPLTNIIGGKLEKSHQPQDFCRSSETMELSEVLDYILYLRPNSSKHHLFGWGRFQALTPRLDLAWLPRSFPDGLQTPAERLVSQSRGLSNPKEGMQQPLEPVRLFAKT